jgi:hypothetical protein
MPIDRDLIRSIRSLDEYDLRRLMIFLRGLLLNSDGPGFEEPEGSPARTGVTYRLEHVRCGKRGCTRCPHGPYWYAYWREDGRLRSRYIGKTLPEPAEAPSSTE